MAKRDQPAPSLPAFRADRMKARRGTLSLSRDDLSFRTRIGSRMIAKYEDQESQPGAEALKAIALGLDCSADYLLGIIDKPKH